VSSKRENLIIQSKNGTGKTLAFSLIMLNNLIRISLSDENVDETKPIEVKGLILAPTREIAI
jgi:superfamily II DNA/RNA helicase